MVNKLEAHRRIRTEARILYNLGDPRSLRKHANRQAGPVYMAWIEGQEANEDPRRVRTNPYPPGKRHDEWDRGFKLADPYGDHHGRNY